MREILKEYASLLLPIRDGLFIAEFLIVSNYVLYFYTSKSKKPKKPLWVFVFAGFSAIISSRMLDVYILHQDVVASKIVEAICYYQFILTAKNTGLILGIDLTQIIKIKNNKNENDN